MLSEHDFIVILCSIIGIITVAFGTVAFAIAGNLFSSLKGLKTQIEHLAIRVIELQEEIKYLKR